MAAAAVSQLIQAIPLGIAWGMLPIIMVDLFPPWVRMSGSSAFSITTALVGGPAPLLATSLIAWTGDIAAPAYLAIFLALVGVGSAVGIKVHERAVDGTHKGLEGPGTT